MRPTPETSKFDEVMPRATSEWRAHAKRLERERDAAVELLRDVAAAHDGWIEINTYLARIDKEKQT